MKGILFLGLLIPLAGCFQAYNGDVDDEIRTVPVTNNPTIVPNHGSIPMMSGPAQAPY